MMMYWPVTIHPSVPTEKRAKLFLFQKYQHSSWRVTKLQGTFRQVIHPTLTDCSSVATTWALFALAQRADVQEKLRVELLSAPTDNPTMDELNALPYLDKVVREVMRLYSPVPLTARVATADDMVPLEIPVKDEEGNIQQYIRSVSFRISICHAKPQATG